MPCLSVSPELTYTLVAEQRGDIKVFDFGFVRELRDEAKGPDETYKLSKMTGSLRYMAPGKSEIGVDRANIKVALHF